VAADYEVVVAPEALVEIVQIAAWWSENRPRAPRLFQIELDDLLSLLAAQPEIGVRARSRRVGNARVVEMVRSRYRVFYQIVPAACRVLVVHVRHGRRRQLRSR
jgi:plasmid stabilization system protein ParE